jgi:biopolymer transport protein ExbD
MTPMIDCVFQLVVFFMLTLNFADDLQNEKIKLPSSELAKPNDAKLDMPITLQLTAKNSVIVGSDEVPISGLRASLQRERTTLEGYGKTPGQATVIIRADRYAKTGAVQEMIEIAQALRFEKFVLRAKGKDA